MQRKGELLGVTTVGKRAPTHWALLQFRVLGLRLLQDGDVRVGVLPQREEILVFDSSVGGVLLENVGDPRLACAASTGSIGARQGLRRHPREGSPDASPDTQHNQMESN